MGMAKGETEKVPPKIPFTVLDLRWFCVEVRRQRPRPVGICHWRKRPGDQRRGEN